MADRAGRGRSAIDIELVAEAPVGENVGRQHPAVGRRAGAGCGRQDHRPGAVAEQHAGAAILPIENSREGLGADHQRATGLADADEVVGHGEGEDEAGADRLDIEGGAAGHAESRLDLRRGRRKGVVRRAGRQHDEIDVGRAEVGPGERRLGRLDRHLRGALAVAGDMALADPGTLRDPGIVGVDALRQLGVGHDPPRQIGPAAGDPRAQDHQTVAARGLAAERVVRWAKSSRIFSMAPCRTMSMATPMALAKPKASVPPWLFTAMPLRPRKIAPL